MMRQDDLLDKYYKGETTQKEELLLKNQILNESFNSPEKDMFEYFNKKSTVPENLEEELFSGIIEKEQKRKSIRMRIVQLGSAAAFILILLTIYIDSQISKNAKLENDFFVMEQALFQISESIQPQEQEEMMVLWVDNNVEIIIN